MPSLVQMQQGGWGGWIVVTTADGLVAEGELISVEPTELRVLDWRAGLPAVHLRRLPFAVIATADLYTYGSEGGFGAWGALGALSTVSHGFWLVFSAPIWLITSGIAAAIESGHVAHRYPGEGWSVFAQWARFPQGMPPQLTDQDLVQQLRQPAPVPVPVPVPAPPAPAPAPEPAPAPILPGPNP